jgi:hypothetical protein
MADWKYPEVQRGTQVEWATEPTAADANWLAGEVVRVKTESCDIALSGFGHQGGRHDCWHAEDPRCKSTPQIYREDGRGVFRIAKSELDKRRILDFIDKRLPKLEEQIAALSRTLAEREVPRRTKSE